VGELCGVPAFAQCTFTDLFGRFGVEAFRACDLFHRDVTAEEGPTWVNLTDGQATGSGFVIDQQGVLRHKQIGPIIGPTYDYLSARLLPALLDGAAPAVS